MKFTYVADSAKRDKGISLKICQRQVCHIGVIRWYLAWLRGDNNLRCQKIQLVCITSEHYRLSCLLIPCHT